MQDNRDPLAIAEDVYQTVKRLEEEIVYCMENGEEKSGKSLEELNRSAFALQVAKDVLENKVAPGKRVTITYANGQLILGK